MQPPTIDLERDAAPHLPEIRTAEPAKEAPEERPAWTPAQRVLFRFLFAYLVLYIFPFPLDQIPYLEIASKEYEKLWQWIVPWVGRQVFHAEITVRPNGSGDTTYNYVQVYCYAVMAAAAAVAWTLLDRRRTDYTGLYRGLRVYVRFYLAAVMIMYGSAKVIKAQFPNPPLDRLLQPFGDASPMGLLWTFMGTSESYNIFTGAGELIGGLLLTARRTTLLGALVCFAVMSHVAALNFSYDVPVKLFSMHLLAISLFLMAPDLGRLARMFVLNRPVEPAVLRPLSRRTWVNRGAILLRTLVVAAFLGWTLHGTNEQRKTFGDLMPRPPLHGIWNVEEFEVDGQVRPPLVTDVQRWRRVIFDYPKVIAIQHMTDARRHYVLDLDPVARTMAMSKRDGTTWKAAFSYTQPEPDVLALEGTLDGRKIKARARRVGAQDFLLTGRGFHWINEYPFNR